MPTYLNHFKVMLPKNRISQDDLLKWLIECHLYAQKKFHNSEILEKLERMFHHYAVTSSVISQRYVEIDDIFSEVFEQNRIYKINNDSSQGADIFDRSNFFSERVNQVFHKLYDLEKIQKRPDHIIHVTCTGYISPSAPQRIVTHENWKHQTDITHAYHMGCYASLPALRLATSLVIAESSSNDYFNVDVVHNEMCSLHMNALAHSAEQIVVQTLFADGHILYSISPQKKENTQNFKILTISEHVIPSTAEEMAWSPAPWGMAMSLSREVPKKIKPELKDFYTRLITKAHLSFKEAQSAIFAIHPGGPKIIDAAKDILELNDEQIKESRNILFERGNMSSATLPHVWNEILNNNYPEGTKVISFAFGPGLTLFGAVFEVC